MLSRETMSKAIAVPGMLFTVAATILTFFDIKYKEILFLTLLIISIIYLIFYFIRAKTLKKVELKIEGSRFLIEEGDIFKEQDGFKVIAFNEYFDTEVNGNIISPETLNGAFIKQNYSGQKLIGLNKRIANEMKNCAIESGVMRKHGGKDIRYELGSIFKDGDYFLLAFSKFDEKNQANLKLSEYALCLIKFWDEVNRLYQGKTVVLPLLGSGITRKVDFVATDQELLEIIIWAFKISKIKFREPSKVKLLMHKSKIKNVSLYDLKTMEV